MHKENENRVLLVILDGWGIGQKPEADAIRQAYTPYIDNLLVEYPNSELVTFGADVGLPEGQMGNSEVGHLNIGAGRVVYQELLRINQAIEDNSFHNNDELLKAIKYAKKGQKKFHIAGLVSDGGIHSHIDHLFAIIDILEEHGVENVWIHAFTDGRDTDPKSGLGFLKKLKNQCREKSSEMATIIGRYYSMDRDKRWDRVKRAYDLIVNGQGEKSDNIETAIKAQYDKYITDEFLEPILLNKRGIVEPGDVFMFFNFRTDRPRQLTRALFVEDMDDHGMKKLPLYFLTMTEYDKTFDNIHIMFQTENIVNTLGEVLSKEGRSQLRITETEKYPHVTFFLNGGREEVFKGEDRILIDSPKVATYDLQPEMSAYLTTEKLVKQIKEKKYDFACINYANADMVGHTGDFEAAKKAAESVDQCVNKLVNKASLFNYSVLIIADHGNSDYMINDDGSPNTAHTKNPVPCILISKELRGVKLLDGILADVAPTILYLMNLPAPKEMTGKVLIRD